MQKRDWSSYNKKLVQRGDLFFMFDLKTFEKVQNFKGKSQGGRPNKYSDILIELLLIMKIQYHLTYRSLEGFAISMAPLIKNWLHIPNYTTICRRSIELKPEIKRALDQGSRCILIDASGIKILGDGEWVRKIHGLGRSREWLKLHVAMDQDTQVVLSYQLTPANIGDSSMMEPLLDGINGSITAVKADGAYSGRKSSLYSRTKKCQQVENALKILNRMIKA